MVRVLRPTFLLLGLALMALSASWVLVPGISRYPVMALQGFWPVSTLRQAKGTVRFFDGAAWRVASEGDSFRGAQGFSAGPQGGAIVEVPGRGFVKLEESSLVTLESSGPGLQVRVVRGNADVRSTTPGAIVLERRPGSRAPIVRAPEPAPSAPTTSPAPERSVARERAKPLKLKAVVKAPSRPQRTAVAPVRKSRSPARSAPAPAPMVPQILPIQVE